MLGDEVGRQLTVSIRAPVAPDRQHRLWPSYCNLSLLDRCSRSSGPCQTWSLKPEVAAS